MLSGVDEDEDDDVSLFACSSRQNRGLEVHSERDVSGIF